jgi:very-short-patch-repair endonuclease
MPPQRSSSVEKMTPEPSAPRPVDPEVAVERLAASQHGLVTVADLRDAGFSPRMIHRRVQKGRFALVHRGVYRVGVGHFPLQAQMAAVLACGPEAVLSHRSAAALWGLLPDPDASASPPHVSVPRSRRGVTTPNVVSHRPTRLPDEDRTVREGIPVTTPVRTVLDLAALAARGTKGSSRGPEAQRRTSVARRARASAPRGSGRPGASGLASPSGGAGSRANRAGSRSNRAGSRSNRVPPLSTRELEQAVARAEREGLATLAELRVRVDAGKGRHGAPLLRRILDAEGGPAFTRSEAERRLLDLIRRGKLPPPATNERVGPFELDFLWRNVGLAAEVDGYAYHGSRERFEGDRDRDAELAAGGIQVLRITWRHIQKRPEVVLVRLAQALEQAKRRAER